MYEVPQCLRAPDLPREQRSSFQARDRVWVKRLNQVGLVHDVRRCEKGGREYYLLRVDIGGNQLLTVLASPLTVEKITPCDDAPPEPLATDSAALRAA